MSDTPRSNEERLEIVQLPKSVVLKAVPMLFWVSQAIQWDNPEHQQALTNLYREAALAVGITPIIVEEGGNERR